MGTINSNPLDHSVNQNNSNYSLTDNFNVQPLDVGGWFPSFIRHGWQCPCCGRVYSPDTPMCLYCGNYDIKTTTGTTIPFEENNSNANIFKSENGYDDLFVKSVTYNIPEETLNEKTIHDVAKLFLPLKNPYKIMKEMGYKIDEDTTIEKNTLNFLKSMEKEGRLKELYELLTK